MKNQYLLIDGYNIIFSWESLKQFVYDDMETARDKLIEVMSNYQGYTNHVIIIVFDAHNYPAKIKSDREIIKINNVYVVYTTEAETADQYIEKTILKYREKGPVRVATSDYVEQIITIGKGAVRVSAQELKREVEGIEREIKKDYLERNEHIKSHLLIDRFDEETVKWFEQMRRNR